jgi:DNA-binding winged helix-turn-helix (wHTH) protein
VRVSFGEFVLDLGRRELLRGTESLHLSPKALELLAALLAHRPEAVAKAELRRALWPATFVAEANIPNLVAEVRTALGDDARKPKFIRTVHSFGYAFCGDALDVTAAPSSRPALYRLELRTRKLELVELMEGENLLGRTSQSVLPLNSTTVSRRHALIRISDGAATLEDLGSKNGTSVDGRRLRSPRKLTHGDQIRFGSVDATFRLLADALSTETIRHDRR